MVYVYFISCMFKINEFQNAYINTTIKYDSKINDIYHIREIEKIVKQTIEKDNNIKVKDITLLNFKFLKKEKGVYNNGK